MEILSNNYTFQCINCKKFPQIILKDNKNILIICDNCKIIEKEKLENLSNNTSKWITNNDKEKQIIPCSSFEHNCEELNNFSFIFNSQNNLDIDHNSRDFNIDIKISSEDIFKIGECDYDMKIIKVIKRILKKEEYIRISYYEIIKNNLNEIINLKRTDNEFKTVYNLIFTKIIERFSSELKQNRNLFNFLKLLFYAFIKINDYKNDTIVKNIKNIKIVENYLHLNNIQIFKNYINSLKEDLLLFHNKISDEEMNNLKKSFKELLNPKDNILSNIQKTQNFEKIVNFLKNLNRYITYQKLKNPNNYINIDEIAKNYEYLRKNINSTESGIYIISLLAKCYELFGININITKEKDENLEDIELASLQYLFAYGGMKKYVLHFDFGEKRNNQILTEEKEQKDFIIEIKKSISEILKIDINNILLMNIRHGSVIIDCIFINQKIIYEKLKKDLNDQIFGLKYIEEKPLIESLQLSSDIFDIIGDRPEGFWCVESAGTIRGGKDYMPPLDGWNGLGLKVADKYDDGNNNWLGYEHEDGEYAIAYMGINKLLDDEEPDINIDSVCLFQNPELAERNAAVLDIIGFKIKIMLMCRVNPNKIGIIDNNSDHWILNPNSKEIRPYRIIVKKIEIPKEPQLIISLLPINYINEAINSKDPSFYELYNNEDYQKYSKINGIEISKELFVIRLYTSIEPTFFKYLNNYLRQEKVEYFSREQLNSFIYCLQSSLANNKNVNNGQVVYRGINLKFPSEIAINSTFYFREFVSTSLDDRVARIYAFNGTLLIIKIKNNGIDDHPNYCFNDENISVNEDEREIIISSHCLFRLTRIDKKDDYDEVYLTCEGYISNLPDNCQKDNKKE